MTLLQIYCPPNHRNLVIPPRRPRAVRLCCIATTLLMTQTDPPPGTWRSHGHAPANWSSADRRPGLTSPHQGPHPATSAGRGSGKKRPQIVLLLFPRLKSSWDSGYFWQFVFESAMLQSPPSQCKLHYGRPSEQCALSSDGEIAGDFILHGPTCSASQPWHLLCTQRSQGASHSPHVTLCNPPF